MADNVPAADHAKQRFHAALDILDEAVGALVEKLAPAVEPPPNQDGESSTEPKPKSSEEPSPDAPSDAEPEKETEPVRIVLPSDLLYAELTSVQGILTQGRAWIDGMDAERFRMTISATFGNLERTLRKGRSQEILPDDELGFSDPEAERPRMIVEAIRAMGVDIKISEDQMKASLFIPKDDAAIWSPEPVTSGLAEQGVVYGIDQEALDALFSEKRYDRYVPVAAGDRPVAGEDAIIEDCLQLKDVSGVPKELSKVKVDLKELSLFCKVEEGQVVTRKTPAIPGKPGSDVVGNEVPCVDGVDHPLPSIPNTRVSEDGLELHSTVDGCAYLESGQVTVVDALVLPNGVNFATGNISTGVSVNVMGDVLGGFRIESAGDITIKGTVEAAELVARGNILIDGGVEGGSLLAGGNIEVKFQNGGTAAAKKLYSAHGPLTQCEVEAHRVLVDGDDGHIIGGKMYAWEDVAATMIGSELGVKTEITLGAEVEKLEAEVAKFKENIEQREERLGKFSEAIGKLNTFKTEKCGGQLPKDKQLTFDKLERSVAKIERVLGKLRKKLEMAENNLAASLACVRTVRAAAGLQSGVVVTIGGGSRTFTCPLESSNLVLAGGDVQNLPYEERTPGADPEDEDEDEL